MAHAIVSPIDNDLCHHPLPTGATAPFTLIVPMPKVHVDDVDLNTNVVKVVAKLFDATPSGTNPCNGTAIAPGWVMLTKSASVGNDHCYGASGLTLTTNKPPGSSKDHLSDDSHKFWIRAFVGVGPTGSVNCPDFTWTAVNAFFYWIAQLPNRNCPIQEVLKT